MHVKYASRHVLYPVPNVLDWIVFIVIVARAVDFFAGPDVAMLRDFVPDIVARFVVGMAARATVLVFALRAVTDFVDAARALRVVFFDVPVRARMSPVRCGAEAVRGIFVVAAERVTELASRTAASAVPTPITNIRAICKTFLIRVLICINIYYQNLEF